MADTAMLTVWRTHTYHPPIESARDPIHSAADMCMRWRALMDPLGFGERVAELPGDYGFDVSAALQQMRADER